MKSVFKEQWQKQVGQKALDKCLEETYSKCTNIFYCLYAILHGSEHGAKQYARCPILNEAFKQIFQITTHKTHQQKCIYKIWTNKCHNHRESVHMYYSYVTGVHVYLHFLTRFISQTIYLKHLFYSMKITCFVEKK